MPIPPVRSRTTETLLSSNDILHRTSPLTPSYINSLITSTLYPLQYPTSQSILTSPPNRTQTLAHDAEAPSPSLEYLTSHLKTLLRDRVRSSSETTHDGGTRVTK